jgi:hypothetical protein
MASTGLLGINPYRGGNVAIDFLSKPTQLAIQLQQKEQAKAEALEKYYMDYEKSINPKGLGRGEGDVFAKKYNQIRQYWMENRDAILHPTKYGYDAQSTYTAGLKDALGYIEQAKQATAERKAFVDYVNKQKASGKHISDNYLDIMTNAMKPVEAGYVAPDFSQIKIYDPHDDISFVDKTWKGVDLPGEIQIEKETITEKGKNKETGRQRNVMVETITPEVAKIYDQKARGYYRSNLGTQEQYDLLFKDKDYKNQLNPTFVKYFNRNITSPEDLLVAQGLASKLPKKEGRTEFDYPRTWYNERSEARSDARAQKMIDASSGATSVEDIISAADTGNKFKDNPALTELTFSPKITGDYSKEIKVPKNTIEYEKKILGAPFEEKTVKVTPVFGKDNSGEIIVAYPTLDKNGDMTTIVDWKNGKKWTNDVKSTIVNKILPSKFKASAISGKKETSKFGDTKFN